MESYAGIELQGTEPASAGVARVRRDLVASAPPASCTAYGNWQLDASAKPATPMFANVPTTHLTRRPRGPS